MPTIILLDVSLSMCRSYQKLSTKDGNSSDDSIDPKQLANVGIGTLLDYLAQNAQLEYTSLIVFSSLWEIRHPFTRHHESIKNGIYDLELYDKSNIVNAVRGALSLKLDEWAQSGPINIILITDGQLHHRNINHNKHVKTTFDLDEEEDVDMIEENEDAQEFHDISFGDLEGQFNFACKIQIVCLASQKEPALDYSIPFYKSLISIVDNSVSDPPVIIGSNTRNYKQSALWLPFSSESASVSIESVENLFNKLAELHYKPFHTNLLCGHLSSNVMISPKPTDCLLEPLKNEFDDLKREQATSSQDNANSKETYVSAINKSRLFKLGDAISICGFMPIQDIASPSVISRHLILPIVDNKSNEITKAEQILSQDPVVHHTIVTKHQRSSCTSSLQTISMLDETLDSEFGNKMCRLNKNNTNDGNQAVGSKSTITTSASNKHSTSINNDLIDQDITKQPSFCILLHNGLKQENMVAICMIGKSEETNEDWFGMIHSHIDSKKRSSLMLSLLIPGSSPVLWLPNFKLMGSAVLSADLPQSIREKITSNRGPLKSYSSNNVIWLDPESVQADVQKIVRHAKRTLDKAPTFYKELNRIRRAAISYGFYDVLFGLANILEREKRVMMLDQNKPINQETLNHIDHVIECLKTGLNDDSYDTNIIPKIL